MTEEARVAVQIRNMNTMAAHALMQDLQNVFDKHRLSYGIHYSKVRP